MKMIWRATADKKVPTRFQAAPDAEPPNSIERWPAAHMTPVTLKATKNKSEDPVLRHGRYTTESRVEVGLNDHGYRKQLEQERACNCEEAVNRVMRKPLGNKTTIVDPRASHIVDASNLRGSANLGAGLPSSKLAPSIFQGALIRPSMASSWV